VEDIVNVTAELLSLGETQNLVLAALREGRTPPWATAGTLGRLRNLGLVTAETTLTDAGRAVADAHATHVLVTRPLRRGAIKGAGSSYGVSARCTCGHFTYGTNDHGKAGLRAATAAHVNHVLAHANS
jgi:hypothetical protein